MYVLVICVFFRFPDGPIFRKREIDMARQLVDNPNDIGLNMLTKLLNGEIYLNPLRKAVQEDNLGSIPVLQRMLMEKKQILLDRLAKRTLTNPRSNEGKYMYYNHILGSLGKRRI